MWEVTLCGKYDDIVYLVDLEKQLKDNFHSDVITAIWISDNVVLNMAITKDEIVYFVKKTVIDTILKIAKTSFFSENIKFLSDDKTLNTFIVSSLVMIEIDEEIDFVYNHISLDKYINIDSFVAFKLFDFYDKWQYLCDYINNTFSTKYEDYVYIDFLKFLTDLQVPKYDILYLENTGKNLEFFDSARNKINSISVKDEIGVIVNLIMYSPKKIVVNCIDILSDKISNLMNYIFEEKVSFLL